MTTLLDLLQGVREAPEDDAPRLVLADWLEEFGSPSQRARAELIRLQCAAARSKEETPRRRELLGRARDLFARHKAEWIGPLNEDTETSRGLLEVWLFESGEPTAEVLADEAIWPWVGGVSWEDSEWGEGPDRLLASHQLRWLTSLWLSGPCPESALLALVSGALTGLRQLDLGRNQLGPSGAGEVCAALALPDLVELYLTDTQLGDEGAEVLARSPGIARLRLLWLMENQISDAGASALAASPYLDGLDELRIWGNRITPAGGRLLRQRLGDRVVCGKEAEESTTS